MDANINQARDIRNGSRGVCGLWAERNNKGSIGLFLWEGVGAVLAICCACMLWVGQAVAGQPFYGSVEIAFPAYSSVQDCMNLLDQGEGSPQECQAYLEMQRKNLREDGNNPMFRDELERHGEFGVHPLYILKASMLHCGESGCEELQNVFVPPPEHIFRAPSVLQVNGKLVYHLPSHVAMDAHVLVVHGLDREWRSDLFYTHWPQTYLRAELDRDQPGHLLLTHAWLQELSDKGNQLRATEYVGTACLLWIGLMLAMLVYALLFRLIFTRWRWRDICRALMGLGTTMFFVLIVIFMEVPQLIRFEVWIALFLYLALTPMECFWLNFSQHLNSNDALRLCVGIKLWMLFFLMITFQIVQYFN
ncbi:MAG: hypothetical protein Q9M17_08475 [Mariprofundus sp.]|nr:hypothetical protein [Mariprofundus sp.]